MVNESFTPRRSTCRCNWLQGRHRDLAARHQELGQRQAREYGGRFIRGLQGRLQRQNLARHLLRRSRFGLVDDILEDGLGLGLAAACVLHQVLGGGEIGLNIRDGLLARLRRQVGRGALAERCDLRGRIGSSRGYGDRGEDGYRFELRTNPLLVGLRAVLHGDGRVDPGRR